MDTRPELVQLLAKVLHRMVAHPKVLPTQNDPHSEQVCLDDSPKEVLSVTRTVNNQLSGENT